MKVKLTSKIISEIGVKEKYLRKNHYNSLKVWWARRPITAMRSLLIKEMYDSNLKDAHVDLDLISDLNPSQKKLKTFAEEFNTNNINVLDVFAGGGSIPLESARLGFNTFSAELNPVASLLQETIFNSNSIPDYSEKLRKSGTIIIENLKNKYSKNYDFNGDIPYVIYCSKISKCVKCNSEIDLKRLQYLSKRKNKIKKIDEHGDILFVKNEIEIAEKTKTFLCKNCGAENTFKDIKEYCKNNSLDYKPFAFCYHDESEKKFRKIDSQDNQIFKELSKNIDAELKTLSYLLPKDKVIKKGGVINPTLYDLKYHYDFFTNRQLLILLGLIDEITNEYNRLKVEYDSITTKQIILGLTCLIEFLVDWNSKGTMWISQNEQTGRSLAGPGVGMKWDFIEINPFYKSGSNLSSKLNRVCDTYAEIHLNNNVEILKGSSTNLSIADKSIDIILTDPPYFDSVDYTGLSEFFRPWFEVLIKNTFDENVNLENDHLQEAIVDLSNGNKNGKDSLHYQNLMTGVLKEVKRVLKDDGKVLMLYSHKTFEGWQVIGEAIRDANLIIENCIPLEMERIARPRAMSYEALNGVIVFKLKNNNHNISTVEKDIEELNLEVKKGEILESHKVIYLASLACKMMTLSNKNFDYSYKEVIKLYTISNLNNDENLFDNLTKNYLAKYLEEKNCNIDLLRKNNLLNLKNEELIKFNNLDEKLIDENSQLYKAVKIFKDFKSNSKTKVEIEETEREIYSQLFSTLSGLNLNTLSNRSSDEVVKVSRLILSKI